MARNGLEANWLSERISSASAPCRCRLPSTYYCGGCAMVPPPPPSPPSPPRYDRHASTTAYTWCCAGARRPHPGVRHIRHTFGFSSDTCTCRRQIHLPGGLDLIARFLFVWSVGSEERHSVTCRLLCSVSPAFRILRNPLMSPFFSLPLSATSVVRLSF